MNDTDVFLEGGGWARMLLCRLNFPKFKETMYLLSTKRVLEIYSYKDYFFLGTFVVIFVPKMVKSHMWGTFKVSFVPEDGVKGAVSGGSRKSLPLQSTKAGDRS